MFLQNKREKPASETNKEQNLVSKGTKITGDVVAQGDFRIDGTVKGTVKTSGKVVVGKNGYINGGLECENVDIEGKIKGKIKVSGSVNLKPTAFVEGEISTAQLSIAPGATFNASCDMKEDKSTEKKKEKKPEIPTEKKTEPKNEKGNGKNIEKKTKKNGRTGQKGKEKQPT
ncbi:MAG TPA: polymer-forming cytoskeletal protein [Salinimicrobium sp.]|nr:polymer-forming cytoskeletal protein [Salinimicrobium sp.]